MNKLLGRNAFPKLGIILCIVALAFASVQAQETSNWYFGSAAGYPNTGLRIDFSSGTPVVSTGYPMLTEEGSSSISDANGNPLFYTDGVSVWDASTNTTFGTALNGGASSTQSAIIMPKQGTTNQWLLFTSGTIGNPGLSYYTVTGSGSPGVSPFSIAYGATLVAAGVDGEGVCIIGSSTPNEYWVITRQAGSGGIVKAFNVNAVGGVSTVPVTSTLSGPSFTNTSYTSKIGTIKSNTCQNKLAFTYYNDDADIVDFNTATGAVVAGTAKRLSGIGHSYGIEFSPNDAYLYISALDERRVYTHTVGGTGVTLLGTTPAGEAGQLQLAPDGKIYLAINKMTDPGYLGVINNPNSNSGFVANGLLVTGVKNGPYNGFAYRGLPTFPKSLVVNTVAIAPEDGAYCQDEEIPLSFLFGGAVKPGSILWTAKGGGQTFTPGGTSSTASNPTVSFSTVGTKTVILTFEDQCDRPYIDSVIFEIAAPKTPFGSASCTAPNLVLDNPAVDPDEPNYIWYKNSVSDANIIGIGTPVNYAVGNDAALPTQICLGVAATATQVTGDGAIGSNASSFGWAANGTPYTSPAITVTSDILVLKSFEVKLWTCPSNLTVEIRNGGGAVVYSNTVPVAACGAGTVLTLDVNTTLPAGTGYTIRVSGAGAQFYGGGWGGAANAQISYAASTTASIGNIQYEYKNFTVTPVCATPLCFPVACSLPVSWLTIDGQRTAPMEVQVSWAVASETNNHFFEIQRSSDGRTFSSVGRVEGRGNVSDYKAYSYTDIEAPASGTVYYRVVQYDYDGRNSATSIVRIDPFATSWQDWMNVYPNPSAEVFHIDWLGESAANYQVYDVRGSLVASGSLNVSQTATFGENLSMGVYVVKVFSEKQAFNIKLVKQ